MFDKLKRRRREEPADALNDGLSPIGAAGEPEFERLDANEATRKKQMRMLVAGGGAALLVCTYWIVKPDASGGGIKAAGVTPTEIKIATGDMVNPNLADKEWQAMAGNRLDSQDNQLKGVQANSTQLAQLQAQVAALQGQNGQMAEDGKRVLAAYQSENEQLKSQLGHQKTAPAVPVPGPNALYGPGSATYAMAGAPGMAGSPKGAGATPASLAGVPGSFARQVRTISFTGGSGGNGKRAEATGIVYSDSSDYLPANSFATAKVIVGVDASAGVASQTDPLPVVLRITGPARSVADNGRVLTTKIQGCLVNGAARGDLSSEKVYVKLQRMTCAQPGGRYAVSEVKGFIAFAGKSGVRGRVVSREGGLVTQAFIAGLAGGVGKAFSLNTQSLLSGGNVTVNGQRQQLGAGDIAQSSLGQGVGTAADTVSKYLIERAEQYQPVIEMPTGIDVEIVFLDGAYVRN